MGFKEHLKRAVDDVPGALLCTLMGHDGLAIDTYQTERSVEKDIMTSTVELTGLMTQVRQSAQGLRSGDLLELTLCGADLTAVVRTVTPEYFLALVVDPQGWAGKGRYLLRVLAPKLAPELV